MSETAATVSNPYNCLDVRPVTSALGAEIYGVDLAKLDDAIFAEIHRAWLDYHVLLFRDQNLEPADQIAFAKRWGDIHTHLFNKALDDYPEITELLKKPDQRLNNGGRWHSDQMYTPQPAKATMLLAREIPERGGDTMFSNLYMAYDALSAGMKDMLTGLKGVSTGDGKTHPSGMTRAERVQAGISPIAQIDPGKAQTISAHPLVRTHPETGRKVLYIGSHTEGIEGWRDEEAKPLLDYLMSVASRPEHTVRLKWRVGSLALWDNRCCQHFAINDYHGFQRRMHKIMICGDEPF